MKTILAAAAAAAAMTAVSAQAARVAFADLEPAQQQAACQALAQAGGGETIYVVKQPPETELQAKRVGPLLTDVFTGEVEFVATLVTSGDC